LRYFHNLSSCFIPNDRECFLEWT